MNKDGMYLDATYHSLSTLEHIPRRNVILELLMFCDVSSVEGQKYKCSPVIPFNWSSHLLVISYMQQTGQS